MVALIVIGSILAFFILIGLIAVGVDAGYEDEQLKISATVMGARIVLVPKPPAKEKKAEPEAGAAEKTQGEAPSKPGLLAKLLSTGLNKDEIVELIKTVLHAAGSLRKKLTVGILKFWFVSSQKDPYDTVMVYNYVNDAVYTLSALVSGAVNVKKWDIRTAVDYNVGKPFVEARIKVTIRIGQMVHIAFAAGIAVLKILIRHKKMLRQQLKAETAQESA